MKNISVDSANLFDYENVLWIETLKNKSQKHTLNTLQ